MTLLWMGFWVGDETNADIVSMQFRDFNDKEKTLQI